VGHLSFFQSNRFLLEELCAAVTIGASGELALDLFAGIGLFTLPLAQRFSKVVAVEANEAAARDLEANIDRGGISAEHRFMDAAPFLRDWRICPDLVVLDPPRSGIAAAAIERLVELAPKRVHYVSCDPATLARDLAKLTAGGYVIEEVHFFDLFPQSFHIESLVLLAR
jgi:23S rRNA (uracil1939-C5)-methyltransferase